MSAEIGVTLQEFQKQCRINKVKKWERFSEWIKCICVVTFDLNLGQVLEFVYPPEFVPKEQEASNICYMAFPDSNSGCMGDTKFHFSLRAVDKPSISKSISVAESTALNEYSPVRASNQSHFWGFVYFRQKKDSNIPRGYFQKSFIIMTSLPYYNLFFEVLTQLAPKYFSDGNIVIKNACQLINREWPSPQAGVLSLNLFEYNYQIFLPKMHSENIQNKKNNNLKLPNSNKEINLTSKIIYSVNEFDLFSSLEFILENLYTIWELVLTAEPIIVVGTSPADCSIMVQTLIALINPLQYYAEARPYFTIHDSEFKEFTKKYKNAYSPVILGVTNPFFVKLLTDWPHKILLADNQINLQQHIHSKYMNTNNSNTSGNNFDKTPLGNKTIPANFGAISSDALAPGLYTKYRPFLKKDKTLLNKVLHGIKTNRPAHVQTALIRRNLLELTQSFMIPLERYVASLMPLQKTINPFRLTPNAGVFNLDDFLSTLEHSGPHLTSTLKGDWRGLYRRFFYTPNFNGWYKSRRSELQLALQKIQMQTLSSTNFKVWAQDKQEVEIVDMMLKLKQKLNLYANKSSKLNYLNDINNTGTKVQLKLQINCLRESLPIDIKDVVNI
ncbi:protein DENND6B-like [Teleopsis dalmanni]|uniref:protein DENND6B-like n=1 Tax=Teleopsis dalmanni TaxID=139649 RepID=UPI0018CCC639|nr:protein DENND6B-like [Teleopsis dalmanni]XP_037933716.1 protein DENND6B-like [Teleopsis dalmanni]